MAPQKKNLNPTGLGRAIINKKARDARQAKESNLYTTDVDSASKLRSTTQEKDLDEFLSTAQLAATDFTAEKNSISVVQSPSAGASSAHNPFLLTQEEEQQALRRHRENKARLRVPRRPAWTRDMTVPQLERQERDAFLDWRRGLAQLQEEEGLTLTPFERNLEVWRQLWRVIERSHLVVQIVDARNPLRFRCEDLELYIKDIEGTEGEHGSGLGFRKSLVLINKSDLLTTEQRRMWADYFDEQGVQYAFFSAANATALQEAKRVLLETGGSIQEGENREHEREDGPTPSVGTSRSASPVTSEELPDLSSDSEDDSSESEEDVHDRNSLEDSDGVDEDSRTRILSVLELEAFFEHATPPSDLFKDALGNSPSQTVVGLVGYPNVGKSSTINALLGEKKVSVSSTPGKTKHFQTINLSPSIILCDCPGLVFPQFTTSTADLVCDGVLPIDQLREYTGPASLVTQRIPKPILEATYGLAIRSTGVEEEGLSTRANAEDLLTAYAVARGYARSGQGNPDEARAARYVLKDYVNGKLLYCHPPPGVSDMDFNGKARLNAFQRMAKKKRAPMSRVTKQADTFIDFGKPAQFNKAQNIDDSFFVTERQQLASRPFVQGTNKNGQQFSRDQSMPHQNIVGDDGRSLEGRRARIASVLALNESAEGGKGKKHFKGNKRVKQRSGRGYE